MNKNYILLLILISTGILNVSSAQNTWTQKANFGGTSRFLATGFSIGNYGYIGTGDDGANRADFWQYDPSNNTWTQKADFGGGVRQRATGFSVGNYGYICAGWDGSNYYNDLWQYDPSNNTWTAKADFPGAKRYNCAGFGIGNYGYVGTGYNGNYYTDFYQYNPATDTWTQKADFGGTARAGATGFALDSTGYIGGGYQNVCLSDFWQYNSTTNSWTQKANIPGTAVTNSVAFTLNCYGYIATGDDGNQAEYKTVFQYNPAGNQWTQVASLPGAARQWAVAFSINGYAYIGTGDPTSGSASGSNDFWQYTPNVCANIAASFQSSNTILCTNECVDFTNYSTNATSWLWLFPGAIPDTSTAQNPSLICYATANSYSVTLIASNSTESDTFTINNYIKVYPSPPTPFISQHYNTLYCTTDPSYSSYQWFLNDTLIPGAVDTSLVISQSGIYAVEVTSENGCRIAASSNITVGIQNYFTDNLFSLYPNPATNQLTIHTSFTGAATISIINVLGQEASTPTSLNMERGDAPIDVSRLDAGVYFLQIKSENGSAAKMFVKE